MDKHRVSRYIEITGKSKASYYRVVEDLKALEASNSVVATKPKMPPRKRLSMPLEQAVELTLRKAAKAAPKPSASKDKDKVEGDEKGIAKRARAKAAGDHWVVQEKVGRRMFSRGIWAASAAIDRVRAELDAERSTEGYTKRQEAAARRREQVQAEYVEDFLGAVLAFLAFHPDHADLAHRLARVVTEHATPVGSGTVARTGRIPVEQRIEAAVIAWMRHHTTGYDGMAIPRVKGKRREVRRMLARRSQELLQRYRRGESVEDVCPLRKALVGDGRGGMMVGGTGDGDAG